MPNISFYYVECFVAWCLLELNEMNFQCTILSLARSNLSTSHISWGASAGILCCTVMRCHHMDESISLRGAVLCAFTHSVQPH